MIVITNGPTDVYKRQELWLCVTYKIGIKIKINMMVSSYAKNFRLTSSQTSTNRHLKGQNIKEGIGVVGKE